MYIGSPTSDLPSWLRALKLQNSGYRLQLHLQTVTLYMLNAKNKVLGINTLAVPVISYSHNILNC